MLKYSLIGDRGKKKYTQKEKLHCRLRYKYFVAVNQIVMTTV